MSASAVTQNASAVAATYRWRWTGLTVLLIAEAMNLLDATIVQVAAPVIHADLGGSVSDIQWFSAAYTLPFALLLVTGGRLGDIAGRRRIFRIGVTAFMLASTACALAPTVGVLIGLRAVQGAAAAVIIPQTIGLIRTMFDGDELSRAMGTIGPVMGLAAVSGPILGGVLTHADLFGSSWRAAFLVNVPLSLAVLAAAHTLIENRAPQRPGLDPVGTVVAMLGIGLIVYPLTAADAFPLTAGRWAAIACGVAVLIAFGWHQRYSARVGRKPLVEASLFSHRRFAAALATSTLFFAVTTGLTLVIVMYLELATHTGVLSAGLSLLPWSAAMGITSLIAGARLVPRYGARLMFVGLPVLILGATAAIAAYHYSTPSNYPTMLLPALGLVGIGVGLFTPAFFTATLKPLKPQEIGSAAGLLNAVRQLGATLGVTVLGSVYLATARPDSGRTALHAIQATFWIAAAVLVVTAVTSSLMMQRSAADVS